MVPKKTLAVDGLFSICCVCESRGIAKEFGLAHLDFVHGVCSLAQFADAPMIPGLLRHLLVANPQLVAESFLQCLTLIVVIQRIPPMSHRFIGTRCAAECQSSESLQVLNCSKLNLNIGNPSVPRTAIVCII